LSLGCLPEQTFSAQATHANTHMGRTLLVVECQTNLNWYEIFAGVKIHVRVHRHALFVLVFIYF
jgi:hypothetical protein